jgi:peroxiredoxin
MRLMFALLLSTALITATAQAAPQIGRPAPDLGAVDADGRTRELGEFSGKFVVLEWTNHECPFVQKHYGANNMQALQKEATAKGAVWLSVVSSAPGKQGHVDGAGARRIARERFAAPSAVLLDADGALASRYAAKTTPHLFIIDPAGTLIYMGGIDSIASTDVEDLQTAKPYVRLALAEAMAGKPVSTPSTRPYGCSIKR